jgi:hypothetical protein
MQAVPGYLLLMKLLPGYPPLMNIPPCYPLLMNGPPSVAYCQVKLRGPGRRVTLVVLSEPPPGPVEMESVPGFVPVSSAWAGHSHWVLDVLC